MFSFKFLDERFYVEECFGNNKSNEVEQTEGFVVLDYS